MSALSLLPSSQMRVVDIAFIILLIVYFYLTFTGKFKAGRKQEDEDLQ